MENLYRIVNKQKLILEKHTQILVIKAFILIIQTQSVLTQTPVKINS